MGVPSPAPKQDLLAVVYHLKKQGRKETTLVAITMRFLGHKNIKNTLRYVHLINFDKDYTCKAASTLDEANGLIEQGFEYITEINHIKLFRKRRLQSHLLSFFKILETS